MKITKETEILKTIINNNYKEAQEMLEKNGGEISEELISYILDNPNGTITWYGQKTIIKKTQLYAVMSKEIQHGKGHWCRIREMMGEKCRKTMSDMGSLLIGNDSFQIAVPNGIGDGITRYAVLEKDEFNSGMMHLHSSCEGEFNIYNYDCDINHGISDTIIGRFGIYFYEGLIVFERWN